jgi:hypothetical protein
MRVFCKIESGAPSPSYDYAASCQVCATLSLEGEGVTYPAITRFTTSGSARITLR